MAEMGIGVVITTACKMRMSSFNFQSKHARYVRRDVDLARSEVLPVVVCQSSSPRVEKTNRIPVNCSFDFRNPVGWCDVSILVVILIPHSSPIPHIKPKAPSHSLCYLIVLLTDQLSHVSIFVVILIPHSSPMPYMKQEAPMHSLHLLIFSLTNLCLCVRTEVMQARKRNSFQY